MLAAAGCLTPATRSLPKSKAAAPVRMAILTGEGDRAVEEPAIAQLEVALGAVKDITLLERAQVRKILAEQKLSAAGFSDPATAVKLGKLLSVEMFLFVERVPQSDPAVCRLQATETLTGIVLAGGLVEESQIAGDMPEVGKILQLGMEKYRVPPAERRYVGILSLRSEEQGPALDGLARTLWILLSSDLQACTNLILLDREHLEWLRQEKNLTAIEQALKTSTVLIEGGLHRNGEKVELALLLEPLAGGELERISLRFLPKELEAFRKELVGAIAARLKLKPSSLAADPEQEGKAFLAQAKMLMEADMKDDYLRAAEAAYALWPDRETRFELAYAYNEQTISSFHRRNIMTYSWSEGEDFDRATEKEQVRSLQFQRQMLTLFCEQLQSDYAQGVTGNWRDDTTVMTWRAACSAPGLGLVTQRAKGEATALQPEVAALQRKLFDIIAQAAKQDPEKYRRDYWHALEGAMERLWLSNLRKNDFEYASAQAAGLREVFDQWRNAPRDKLFFNQFSARLLRYIDQGLEGLAKSPLATEARNQFRSAFSAFAHDPDAEIRVMALFGLFMVDRTAPLAEDVLKCLREDIQWNHFDGTAGYDRYYVEALGDIAAKRAIGALLEEKNPTLAAAYCEGIMGPWMKDAGNPRLLSSWGRLFTVWGGAVEQSQGEEQAAAVYERIIAALRDCLNRWPECEPAEVRREIRQLESLRAELGVAPLTAAADDPWKQYEMRPLGLKLNGRASAVIVQGDRLYCILGEMFRYNRADERPCRVTVSVHKFPEGGPAFRTQTLDVPPQEGTAYCRTWPALIGDHLYVGVPGGVLTCSDNEPLRLLTEADGVPGKDISAMAAYGGKLYMGLGVRYGAKHAFAVYDPATRVSRIIFSTTALEPERRRNMDIQFILADEERKCLWITGDVAGLHRYVPETDTVDIPRDMGWGPYYGSMGLAFCPGGLYGAYPLAFVDLQTFKPTALAAPRTNFLPDKEAPVFGYPGVHEFWPAWYDGTTLIMHDYAAEEKPPASYLYLLRPGKEAAPFKLPGRLETFTITPQGLVITDAKGDGCLIAKKSLPKLTAAPEKPAKRD
jgi:hypothetical protein